MVVHTLQTLYERQDLNKQCICLLNEEWPRSDGSREHSQAKSCRESPPMSLLLVELAEGSETLVGHARVCRLPNRDDACWIESVIIKRVLRGRGIGKMLMTLVEDHVRRFGFTRAYLSTEDQEAFYTKCGYSVCEPILHSTTATSVFPIIKGMEHTSTQAFCPPSERINGSVVPGPRNTDQSTVIPESRSSIVPPPPPPPPLARNSSHKKKSSAPVIEEHIYMTKSLV